LWEQAERLEHEIEVLALAGSSVYALYEALHPKLVVKMVQGISFTITAAAAGLRGRRSKDSDLLSNLVCLFCLVACTGEVASQVGEGLAFPVSQRILFSKSTKKFHQLSRPVQKMVRRTSQIFLYGVVLAIMGLAHFSDEDPGFHLNAVVLGAYLVTQGVNKVYEHVTEDYAGRVERVLRELREAAYRRQEEQERRVPKRVVPPRWKMRRGKGRQPPGLFISGEVHTTAIQSLQASTTAGGASSWATKMSFYPAGGAGMLPAITPVFPKSQQTSGRAKQRGKGKKNTANDEQPYHHGAAIMKTLFDRKKAQQQTKGEVEAREEKQRTVIASSGLLSWSVIVLVIFGLVFPQEIFYAEPWPVWWNPLYIVSKVEQIINQVVIKMDEQ